MHLPCLIRMSHQNNFYASLPQTMNFSWWCARRSELWLQFIFVNGKERNKTPPWSLICRGNVGIFREKIKRTPSPLITFNSQHVSERLLLNRRTMWPFMRSQYTRTGTQREEESYRQTAETIKTALSENCTGEKLSGGEAKLRQCEIPFWCRTPKSWPMQNCQWCIIIVSFKWNKNSGSGNKVFYKLLLLWAGANFCECFCVYQKI